MLKSTIAALSGAVVTPRRPVILGNHIVARNSYVEKTISYRNTTYHDITVIDRSGVAMVVKCTPDCNSPEFVICVRYDIAAVKLVEFIQHQHSKLESGNDDLMFIIKQAESYTGCRGGRAHVDIEYSIEQRYLDSRQNCSRYLENLDILISTRSIKDAPPHPYSRANAYLAFRDSCEQTLMKDKMFTKIEIVDNEGVCGPRFTKIADTIFRIDPIVDETRTPGVYFYYNPNDKITANPESYIRTRVFTFEAGDKILNLHRTKEAAEFSEADKIERAKAELAELQGNIQRMKSEQTLREHENAKRLAELEAARREREHLLDATKHRAKLVEMEVSGKLVEDKTTFDRLLQEEKFRYEQMKMEHDKLRAELESRNHIWKSTSENLKSIIAIVGSVAALGVMVWKTVQTAKA